MEFRFNVNEIFKYPIVEINSSLIPPGLSLADKRALWDAVGKVSDVVNAMGEASATAQGLTKPITTSERLRNSEHKLYLLLDQSSNNGKGVVTGMLKTGKKGLYVFDRDGHHYQVQPACVLDFYVHESKQRMGLGKKLFEHMLEKEQVEPVKMAIDRPSDKFLGFLTKHYGLEAPVKQMNNFVVFDGFFPETKDDIAENNNTPLGKSNQPANGLQSNYSSPYGRYGAPRPPCSMGQIIHNQSPLVQQAQEPAGTSLYIRAPVKNRSIYSDKHQTNSNGMQQSSQRTLSNTWNSNQNSHGNSQLGNHQQSENNYNANLDRQQMTSNTQMRNTQNQYVNSQSQQEAYNNMYNQVNQNPQIPYNQMQYGVQQNIQQPHQQNQVNVYQNQQQQNEYTSNALVNNQQQFPSQQQPYMPDKTQNTQTIQQSPQAGDIQPQQRKSVQFLPDQQNTQPQTQSMYEQTMQGSQPNSIPNIAYQQFGQPSGQTNVQAIPNIAAQYIEPVNTTNVAQNYQGPQNNFQYNPNQYPNLNQMQHLQQPMQNIQQQLNNPQAHELMYQQPQVQQLQQQQPQQVQQLQQQQPQQVQQLLQQQQQDMYQPQYPQQNTYQQQQPQHMTYRQQQEGLQPYQAPQQVHQPMQSTYQPQYSQHSQQVVNRQQKDGLQSPQGSQTIYQAPQQAYQPQYSHQPQQVTNQQQQERLQPHQGSQMSYQTPEPTYQSNNSSLQKQHSSQAICTPQHSNQTHQQQSETIREQQYDQNNNMQGQRINTETYQSNGDGKTQAHASQGTVNQQNNYQHLQNPMNYQTNHQSNVGDQQPMPVQNIISNQQIPPRSAQNIQITNQTRQSQHNIAPQQHQIQHQVDPSRIIPPAETSNNQMNKNYQYYDSNSGRMQGVNENVKYSSGTGVGMPPNASGDMQPK